VEVTQRKHHSTTVNVFSFRQPSRLSEAMLPFDLALVSSNINPSGIVDIPTPPMDAADSWFPGYAWSSYVVCTAGGAPVHLGWRYTRMAGSIGAGPDSFVALIVRTNEREAPPVPAGRLTLPINVAVAVHDGEDGEETGEAEVVAQLTVGEKAPGYILAMLAAVTARHAPSAA
jgi:hypothetical protein